ncbi:hypothetical protein [Bradyrhizobium sp. AZCC 2289]|uniref:hypothetical protein n=1 Tax=Bradyrhizobium sp. AZCC 2289 TaxID=3117026 RepID=UPI002FF2CB3A
MSVEQLEIKGAFSMETKQPRLIRSRAEVAIAALVVVVSIAAGSAVLAQDSSAKSATPPAADKMGTDAGGSGMMGMGSDGNGMMGMMSGMQKMKCCGQGMGHSDHGASEKQDEKK